MAIFYLFPKPVKVPSTPLHLEKICIIEVKMIPMRGFQCTPKHNNLVKMLHTHRERQEKLLNIYKKREIEFMKKMKEQLLEADGVKRTAF